MDGPAYLDVLLGLSLVQIEETVPPETMFGRYQYHSSFSNTLLEHSRHHADELMRTRDLGPNSLVVELASREQVVIPVRKVHYAAAALHEGGLLDEAEPGRS